MRLLFSLIAAGLTFGCTAAQVTKVQSVNQAICQADATYQPIVVTLVAPVVSVTTPAAAPAIAGAVALDTTLIHPDIVAACAALNAKAVGAIPTP